MKNPKLAIIGRGNWGSKIIKYASKEFDVKYYIGNEPKKLKALLKDKDVPNVIVATPIETHFDLCGGLLLSQKNVYCEKPITVHKSQALLLKDLAQDNKLKLGVDYTYTFSRTLNEIKELTQHFGPVEYYEFNLKKFDNNKTNYNVYWVLACHMLSVLDMFENIKNIDFLRKDIIKYNELCSSGIISFNKGTINVSLTQPKRQTSIVFYFNNAIIDYNPLLNKMEITTFVKEKQNSKQNKVLSINENHNLKYSIQYFKNLILGKEESNIDMAIRVTDILERVCL